jgi:hypothetical protein
MPCYARILSWLGSKEANKIAMKCKEKETKYKETIRKLLAEKAYLLSIIAQNVSDIAEIKDQLVEVNNKLTEVVGLHKKSEVKIQFIERENQDLTVIIEAFLEKYPDARLSEMVRKKNENEIT